MLWMHVCDCLGMSCVYLCSQAQSYRCRCCYYWVVTKSGVKMVWNSTARPATSTLYMFDCLNPKLILEYWYNFLVDVDIAMVDWISDSSVQLHTPKISFVSKHNLVIDVVVIGWWQNWVTKWCGKTPPSQQHIVFFDHLNPKWFRIVLLGSVLDSWAKGDEFWELEGSVCYFFCS